MSTTTFTSGKLKFEIHPGTAAKAAPRAPDAPLHILIMGKFTGSNSSVALKPVRVDCDNFDQIMAGLQPQFAFPELVFSSLEDFHPDRILPRWRDELRESETPESKETRVARPSSEANQDLIARLMGGPAPSPPPPPKTAAGGVDIGGLLKSAVGDAAAPATSAAEQAARSASNLARTTALRNILHDRNFQTLEANWRGLDLLVRSFGAEETIALSLVDCDFDQFVGDVSSTDDLRASAFFKLLQRRASDERFAVVLGLYTFDPSPGHFQVLGRAAEICEAQATTFIAAASPAFAGCDSFSVDIDCRALAPELQTAWEKVRALLETRRVALALPRFLLRQPYGAAGEPIESFSFEELPPDLPHEKFLWGNPAILCGHVLADGFLVDGWNMSTSGFGEVGDLPVYRFKQNGETKVKPCAEAWMPESVAERISAQGLIPILSIKGRDAVRVGSLRSISASAAPVRLQ